MRGNRRYGRSPARRGAVLVVAVVAMAVIGLLVAAAHLTAVQEQRRGDRRLLQSETLAAAEYAVERAAASAPFARWRALSPGATDSLGPWNLGGATAAARITRLGDPGHALVLIEGLASAGAAPLRRASRATSLTLSLEQGRLAPLGALTVSGPLRLGPGAIVEGADLPPAGWSCPLPGSSLPGVATADASTVVVACGTTCLGGAPPIVQVVAAADSTSYVAFGSLAWRDLVAGAVIAPAVVSPAPSTAAGVCLTSDPANWGDPRRNAPPGGCEGYVPVIHAPGDLHITGGVGQGILLVDGDLTISGGMGFAGLIVTRGTVTAQGLGGRVDGALMAGALGGGASDLDAPLSVVYSACAIASAEIAARRLRPIPFRAWAEVY